MMRALWSAASGMIAQQTNVDTISNNLSNVNTTGYRTEKTEFKSLLYQTLQTRTTTANGEQKPIPAQVGLGTRVASNTSDFTQGALLASDSETAFAIEGEGFFGVQGLNGETYYTRNGDFHWMTGTNGMQLSTSDGYAVLDTAGNPIVLDQNIDSASVKLNANGEVYLRNQDGTQTMLGQTIGLYQFNNPAGLNKISGTFYTETEASGIALNEATNNGLIKSKLAQNYLEGSNVQVADEMVNLIVAQRAYELNSKAIQTADDMLGQANSLKR